MTGQEIVEFSLAVKEAFQPHELKELLLGMNRRIVDYVVEQTTYPDQVTELVASANSQGWIGQFVAKVVKDRPNSQAIRDFLGRNPHFDPAINPAADHPCDTLFVFGGKCFIGRRDFRKFLKTMNTPTGKKVLLVTSDRRKVGKTYSQVLITFAMNHPASRVIPIDLDQDDYDPGKLAATIARLMGIAPESMPPQGQQQATRWNQELVSWLVPVVPNPTETTVWWIVLDGFRLKMLSEAMQDFISQLAQRIQDTTRFRLILLNYTHRLPLAVEAFVFKEKVEPIAQSEVQTFLARVHERRHGTEPAEHVLAEYVSAVYERLARYTQDYPESAEDQLLLNMAVSEAAEIIQG